MKPRGRPPKSLEDHELEGTLRANEHGHDSLSFRPEGYAVKPSGLGKHGSWCWDFIIDDLHRERVARKIDTIKLTAACEWYERYKTWGKSLDELGPEDTGMYRLAIAVNMAWKSFDGIASEFGLSPASRMRIRISAAKKKKNGILTRQRTA